MYFQLIVYIPATHLEEVKEALFKAGAGRQGNYDKVCWQTLGQGQFRPLANANPNIGKQDKLSFVEEYKVEMLCDATVADEVIQALKHAHPYEEPAYAMIALEKSP